MTNLLTIDWDYFIPLKQEWCGSFIENKRNTISIWYQRYLESQKRGEDIEKSVTVDTEFVENFISILIDKFDIKRDAKLYVSDSHKLSYYIARRYRCKDIYSFDAHTDLGYGGLASLEFEVNCANWLGKVLKDSISKRAYIILSPFSYEDSDQFKEINNKFHIQYPTIDTIDRKPEIYLIHIARSGAWTPPWLDHIFFELIDSFNRPYKVFDFKHRHWDPHNISLSHILYNLVI